nr:ImmA/IrrE family metallo-endopeptidase [Corynebacterium amycolatum]
MLEPTLGAVNRRCTLAHELAHAIRGDIPSGSPHFDARAERAADQIAAELLISPTEYAAAEALYGAHDGAIARELGVTTHLLAVWRDTYERTRS